MRIEFSMGDFERIFYALSICYIHFLLFFHFHKEITELNVNLTFSIDHSRHHAFIPNENGQLQLKKSARFARTFSSRAS